MMMSTLNVFSTLMVWSNVTIFVTPYPNYPSIPYDFLIAPMKEISKMIFFGVCMCDVGIAGQNRFTMYQL